MLQMHWQRGEIGVLVGEHDFMDRRLCGWHFDRRNRMLKPCAQHSGKLGLFGLQCGCQPASTTHDIADQLGALRSDRTKPHRIWIAVEYRGDIDEIDRPVVDDALSPLHKFLHEMAQAEFFRVDLGHGCGFRRGRNELILAAATERVQKTIVHA